MKGIFITGTDTGVGKTIITGLLARYLKDNGYSVITQKWIQTGSTRMPLDVKLHFKFMKKNINEIKGFLKFISPYVFKLPASPHLASRLENKKISRKRIIESFKILSQRFDFVIVEGIGGLLVPMDSRHLVIELVKELNLPVLVVAENKLGTINHTLLTIEALRLRKIRISGIVFNNIKKENKLITKDNPRIIKRLTGKKVFGVLPRGKSEGKLYKEFIPIARKIEKTFNG